MSFRIILIAIASWFQDFGKFMKENRLAPYTTPESSEETPTDKGKVYFQRISFRLGIIHTSYIEYDRRPIYVSECQSLLWTRWSKWIEKKKGKRNRYETWRSTCRFEPPYEPLTTWKLYHYVVVVVKSCLFIFQLLGVVKSYLFMLLLL